MTTAQVAQRLIALCREQKWEVAQRELYAPNAKSIEPHDTPMSPREVVGLPAIVEKGKKFVSSVETMHKLTVSEPLIATNAFACTMQLDVTMKGAGRMEMAELCVYQVENGKIVSEQFFM